MIPENWTVTTVGEHADVLTGFAFKSADYTSTESDVKLLRGDNVAPHKLRWRDVKRFPSARAAEVARYGLRAGDFVIAMDRTWLPSGVKIAEVTEPDLPCLLVQRVARLRAKKTLHQVFMKHIFSDHRFDQYVRAVQTETAVPHISPIDLREYPIALPPPSEQRRIAEMLSAWDRAIVTTEKLIANARVQKAVLMRSLLQEKRRLPGFTDDWTPTTLGSRGDFRKGKGISRAEVRSDGIPCVRYGEIYTRHHDVVREFGSFIDPASASDSEPIGRGDLLFACSGETAEEIGKCVAYTAEDAAYAGGDIIIFRPRNDNPIFLAYLLNSPTLVAQKSRMGQGHSVVHISASNLAKLKFNAPSRREQDAIAQRLFEADTRAETLISQLHALQQERAALRQQLLTGRRRVTPQAEAA